MSKKRPGIIYDGRTADLWEFEDLDDAFGMCAAMTEGEGWWDFLEFDGKVYTDESPEWEEFSRKRWAAENARMAAEEPRDVRVEVRQPGDREEWVAAEWLTESANPEPYVKRWTALVGPDRVRVRQPTRPRTA